MGTYGSSLQSAPQQRIRSNALTVKHWTENSVADVEGTGDTRSSMAPSTGDKVLDITPKCMGAYISGAVADGV